MRMFSLFILTMTVAIFSAEYAIAADYYVSPDGTASWSACTNIDTPCDIYTTISNLQAGDTTYLRAGTYDLVSELETVHPGSSGSPIVLKAYQEEVPIITADGFNSMF